MFISKQFRNFVQSKESVFRDCTIEVIPANSIQISFSIVEILPKEFVAHQELNLLRSRMNVNDFLLKCWQIVYCVITVFLLENTYYTVLQSLHLYIPHLLL